MGLYDKIMKLAGKDAKDGQRLWREKYQGKRTKSRPEPKEKFTQGEFVPGKMYSFIYANTKELPKGQYVDNWPLLLAFGMVSVNGQSYETGIDLNLVPPKVRPFLLGKFMEYFGKTIQQNDKLLEEGKRGEAPIKIDFKTAQAVLSGTGFESAYVMLTKDLIAKVQVIDYADWPAMSNVYTQGVRGIGIQDVYKRYAEAMGKNVVERATLATKIIDKIKK